MIFRFPRFPTSRVVDDEDHVTKCLLWIKGMKREKSMHFQYGIYPEDVMHCLKERAEELGLKLEVRDNAMFIGINPQISEQQIEELPKMSSPKLAALNEKVQSSIREYFTNLMVRSRNHGMDRFSVQTKGYFMRPEWVAKQIVEIGKSLGFDIVERDGSVELIGGIPQPPPQLKQPPDQGLSRYFSMPPLSQVAQFPIQVPPPSANSSSHVRPGLSRSQSVNYYTSGNSNPDGIKKLTGFSGFKLGGGQGTSHMMESRSFPNIDEEMKALNRQPRKGASPPTESNLELLWNKAGFHNGNHQKGGPPNGRRMKHDQTRQNPRRQSPKNGATLPSNPPPPSSFQNGNNNRNNRPRGKTRRGRGGRGGRNQQNIEQTNGGGGGGNNNSSKSLNPPPPPPPPQS